MAFHGVCMTFSLHLRSALLGYALRFHGVRTTLPRRSGSALTACSQTELKSNSLYVCFQEDPLISALASVCDNDHAENV